jgi:hypothetical protein
MDDAVHTEPSDRELTCKQPAFALDPHKTLTHKNPWVEKAFWKVVTNTFMKWRDAPVQHTGREAFDRGLQTSLPSWTWTTSSPLLSSQLVPRVKPGIGVRAAGTGVCGRRRWRRARARRFQGHAMASGLVGGIGEQYWWARSDNLDHTTPEHTIKII